MINFNKMPADVIRAFQQMESAVMNGVIWDGSYDSISGVSIQDVHDITSDFITIFRTWFDQLTEETLWDLPKS